MVVSELEERFELAMRTLGWSAGYWAEKAGLSRNVLNKFLLTLRQKPDTADMGIRTLGALADVANISTDWLILGRGTMQSVGSISVDKVYPSRAAAVGLAMLHGIDQAAIAVAVNMDPGGPDPGSEFWWRIIEGEAAKLQLSRRRFSPRANPRMESSNVVKDAARSGDASQPLAVAPQRGRSSKRK